MSGARSRLVTFAEIDDEARSSHDFWIERRMHIYMAGQLKDSATESFDRLVHIAGARGRLLTFADIDGLADDSFRFWIDSRPDEARVFLDSGAFGAYMRKTTIDLGRYCAYVEEHAPALACYAALDVIGDWRGTQRNVEAMEARGLRPIPTFHRGSPWAALDWAAERPYIAIGGLAADTSRPGVRQQTTEDNTAPFLDELFRRLEPRWPVKVHAFGMVSQWALERYPLYSADSATAIVGGGMGRVLEFSGGRMHSRPWTESLLSSWDGVIADGVGHAVESKSKSAHTGRRRRNIEATLAYERYVTDLWTSKGVRWDEEEEHERLERVREASAQAHQPAEVQR